MADPLSLSFAREALRTAPEDDAVLKGYIDAAKASVYRYLGWAQADFDAASAEDRDIVKAAVLMLAGHYYRSPDMDETEAFGHGQLPWMVTASLYQLRDPPLA